MVTSSVNWEPTVPGVRVSTGPRRRSSVLAWGESASLRNGLGLPAGPWPHSPTPVSGTSSVASKYEELECLYAAVGKVIYEGLTNYEKATSANPSQLFGECASCLAHVSLLTWTGLLSGKGTACQEELWADVLLRVSASGRVHPRPRPLRSWRWKSPTQPQTHVLLPPPISRVV